MFQRWPKRDPVKHYYLVPNEVFNLGLTLMRSPSTITFCAARIAEPTSVIQATAPSESR